MSPNGDAISTSHRWQTLRVDKYGMGSGVRRVRRRGRAGERQAVRGRREEGTDEGEDRLAALDPREPGEAYGMAERGEAGGGAGVGEQAAAGGRGGDGDGVHPAEAAIPAGEADE